MANHPYKDQAKIAHADKLRKMVSGVPKPSDPWSRAERISAHPEPRTMSKPPVEAVPQFQNDRSIRSVEYGSTPPESEDD